MKKRASSAIERGAQVVEQALMSFGGTGYCKVTVKADERAQPFGRLRDFISLGKPKAKWRCGTANGIRDFGEAGPGERDAAMGGDWIMRTVGDSSPLAIRQQ